MRHRVERDFTLIQNALMRESKLSFKALGLLSFLLHLPPDFRVSVGWLVRQKRDGRHAVRAAIQELRLLGYMGVEQRRSRSGTFAGWVWWVTDLPKPVTPVESPKSDFPTSVFPMSENRTLISTSKEQILNTTTTVPSCDIDLVPPPGLHEAELVVVMELIKGLEAATAQALMDELAGLMAAGKVKHSRIALLRELVARSRLGAFTPTHGVGAASRRAQEAKKARAREEAISPAKQKGNAALAKARLAEIVEQLR